MVPETVKWENGKLFLLDQRRIPEEEIYTECSTSYEVAEAIVNMTVRGAPAIGVAAAYGAVLALKEKDFTAALAALAASRPTAVNLRWAVERMKKLYSESESRERLYKTFENEAIKIHNEDIEINKKIGKFGAELLPDVCTVITHCNAGALATAGYGTALGVFRAAAEVGKKIKIYADETRPRLQGARLTAYELARDGFDVTVITDGMASYVMSHECVDAVITGADRIAANGDTANKIGTCQLAIAAKYFNVPFYIAAPKSTFDASCRTGADIPIEERSGDEVRKICGVQILSDKIKVRNPSFDVTPHELIKGIITEYGVQFL